MKRTGGDKELVTEMYPLAYCVKLPKTVGEKLVFNVVTESQRGPFSWGHTAAQAWRRAYEPILREKR